MFAERFLLFTIHAPDKQAGEKETRNRIKRGREGKCTGREAGRNRKTDW